MNDSWDKGFDAFFEGEQMPPPLLRGEYISVAEKWWVNGYRAAADYRDKLATGAMMTGE